MAERLHEEFKFSYENVITNCKGCGNEVIFNRATDLKTTAQIAGMETHCPHCGDPIWITGDIASPAHEVLLFDCYDLFPEKHYMSAVLNVAQAYESFFALYLRVT